MKGGRDGQGLGGSAKVLIRALSVIRDVDPTIEAGFSDSGKLLQKL